MSEEQKLMHDFLIEEYKHASEYSLTILRDRTQIFSLYVVLFAAISLANTQLYINRPALFGLFIAIVLFFYGLVNFFSFTHFATLQAVYVDSISRMDDVRQCYKNLLITDDPPDTLKRIFSVENREFINPNPKKLRPPNLAICVWYTALQLASFIGIGVISYLFLSIQLRLNSIADLVAVGIVIFIVGLAIYNYKYYCSVNKVCSSQIETRDVFDP